MTDRRHINLDRVDKRIKDFICSLPVDSAGSILELDGRAICRVFPPDATVDAARVKSAIENCREESRRLNEDWRHADRELNKQLPEA